MEKKKRGLSRFACTCCGETELTRGGNTAFLCGKCKPANHYTLSAQYLAHKAVADAKKRGDIKPASEFACVDCGAGATEYDHRDYAKPLAVDPVCRRCNAVRGPALNKQPTPQEV